MKVMPSEIQDTVANGGVVAVLSIENVNDAVPTAQALVDGGITVIELALRSEAALPAIEQIITHVPQMHVGVGTILFKDQVKKVQDMGALFGVSPGFNPEIVKEASALNFPFAPGISTASEIEAAYALGCDMLKLFPAGPLGGVDYLKAMSAPYNHLNLRYFPLGGVSEKTLRSWAQMSSVITVGGSWIANKQLIAEHKFEEITHRAIEAQKRWKESRG